MLRAGYTIYVCPECGAQTGGHDCAGRIETQWHRRCPAEPVEVVPRAVADELAAAFQERRDLLAGPWPAGASEKKLRRYAQEDDAALAKYREATKGTGGH